MHFKDTTKQKAYKHLVQFKNDCVRLKKAIFITSDCVKLQNLKKYF